jgi:hypothetical protein
VLTVFSRKLPASPEHTGPAIIPTDLFANKIICGHRPALQRLAQLGIRRRRAKGDTGKSGGEEKATRDHLSSSSCRRLFALRALPHSNAGLIAIRELDAGRFEGDPDRHDR